MNQSRNLIGIFFLAMAMIPSCADEGTGLVHERVAVDVIKSEFPTEAQVNEEVQIQVIAQAPNGCYSDIRISLAERGEDKPFLIKATARLVSLGACPQVLVSKDSVLRFKPKSPGEYHFHVNEAPFKVREYTIKVN